MASFRKDAAGVIHTAMFLKNSDSPALHLAYGRITATAIFELTGVSGYEITFMDGFDYPGPDNYHYVSHARNLDVASGSDGAVHMVYSLDPYSNPIAGGTEVRSALFYVTKPAGGSWSSPQTLVSPGSGFGDGGIGASVSVAPDGTVAVATSYLPRVQTGSPGVCELLYLVRGTNGSSNSSVVANASNDYLENSGQRGTGLNPKLHFAANSGPHIVFTDHAAGSFPGWGSRSFSGQVRHATRGNPASGAWSLQTLVSRGNLGPLDFQTFRPTVTSAYGQVAVSSASYKWSESLNIYESAYSLNLIGNITVPPPSVPVITSILVADGVVGYPFTYQIAASGVPSSFAASGLPTGLSIDTGSGLISGPPAVTGNYSSTLSATNQAGTGTALLDLEITGDGLITDRFSSGSLDPARWMIYSEGASLIPDSGRLNYVRPGPPTSDDYAFLDFIASTPGYDESWEVVVDVVNAVDRSDPQSQYTGLGVSIFNPENPYYDEVTDTYFSDGLFLELGNEFSTGMNFFSNYSTDGVDNPEMDNVLSAGVNGSLRISYNGATKVFSIWVDANGSGDGFQWQLLSSYGIAGSGGIRNTDWNMTTAGNFQISLYGLSSNLEVSTGAMTFDNFIFTNGMTGSGLSFASWPLLPSFPADRRGPLDRNGPLGLQNLMAFSMGLDPLSATATDLPVLVAQNSSSGTAIFRYRRAKNIVGTSLLPMTSGDLLTWNPATILDTTLVEDGGEWEVVDVQVPAPLTGRLFFQLRAE